ncbi:uncharacterized protein [Physcomitrium patens]|uniref:VOC domain-containing protein n=1 Tax=Physcomitrium patens TaxID=3218 RepID=A0A7I4A803_PHYPA|nr:uncharacterized protein LOC112287474 isoform X2 [Physcomitrium patens]|eukprot:XP_024386259.1 uncharacterized protein LOC112287474 isoform X2 [Physcomitrella patens]
MGDVSPFQGVHLHHIARETSDVNRLVDFYQQVFGFKKLETPQSFGDFNVTWLHLPPIYSLHVVERDPKSRLPESPFVVPSDANADVSALWRGPHLSFRVSDYDAAINTLKGMVWRLVTGRHPHKLRLRTIQDGWQNFCR